MSSKFFPIGEVVVWTGFGHDTRYEWNSRSRSTGVLPKDRPVTGARG